MPFIHFRKAFPKQQQQEIQDAFFELKPPETDEIADLLQTLGGAFGNPLSFQSFFGGSSIHPPLLPPNDFTRLFYREPSFLPSFERITSTISNLAPNITINQPSNITLNHPTTNNTPVDNPNFLQASNNMPAVLLDQPVAAGGASTPTTNQPTSGTGTAAAATTQPTLGAGTTPTTPTQPSGTPTDLSSFDFTERSAALDRHREQIQQQINAIEQYLKTIHERVEGYRQLSEQLLQRSREEMEAIVKNIPQREPISKPEAIAVAIATLFNPTAAGAVASGILAARERRYTSEMERYQKLAENAIRRYQIESQQVANQLRNLIDYAQTDLQRNMALLQSLYNQLGATEQQKNQLLRLQLLNEWNQARLELQRTIQEARLDLNERRFMLDFWRTEEELRRRQSDLLNRTIRILAQGGAANMTPEQIQQLLQSMPGLEDATVLNHPAMIPLLENIARLAQSSQTYRSARANLAQTSADLLARFGEEEWKLKLENLATRIKSEQLRQQLMRIRASLLQINLNDAKNGRISPSALNQLATTLIMMDQIAAWAEANGETLDPSFYEIREVLGEVMMINLRPLGINANLNPRPRAGNTPSGQQPAPSIDMNFGPVATPSRRPTTPNTSNNPSARRHQGAQSSTPARARRGTPVGD